MGLSNLKQKFSKLSTGKKVGVGVAAAAVGYGAYKLGKKLFKKKGFGKAGSLARLKTRIMKKALKIKDIQLTRKLFKEQLRPI